MKIVTEKHSPGKISITNEMESESSVSLPHQATKPGQGFDQRATCILGCCAEHGAPLVPYIQGTGLKRQNACARKKKKEVEVPLLGNVIQEQMMGKVWTSV